MKALTWILVILALAVGLVLAIQSNVGYVLLVYPPYRIDFSLNFLIILVLTAFATAYTVIRLVIHTLRLPAYVRQFKEARRKEKGRRATEDALIAFAEGRFARAERFAQHALVLNDAPAVNALTAARAAQEQRAYHRRDEYLARAEKLAPHQAIARLMTQADLLIESRQPQDAMPVVQALKALSGKHVGVLRLELKAQQLAKNWDQVLLLLTQLEKREGIESVQAEQLRINAHIENLKHKAHDAGALQAYWSKLAAGEQANSKVALAAARYFLALGGTGQARAIIEESLAKHWDSALVELYGQCADKDGIKQIERAENWLQDHPRDPYLLLALGRLCTRQELWGKAQSYIEASLSVESTRAAHLALAQLLEKTNQTDEACKHYRQSLALES
ncbi:MAG: heme biosynthesis HemY N-terminal domain-containing protein [Burkholderiales bacterium]